MVILIACGRDVDLSQEVLSPFPVDLVFPENNTVCTTGTVLSDTESEVLFRWSVSENADSYEVILINLDNEDIQSFETESNELVIRLLRGTPYSWFVTSIIASNGNSSESETTSFYNAGPGLIAHVPFPATAVSPQNNSQLPETATTATLRWQANDLDNDIVSYDVYFGDNDTPNLFAESLTTNSVEIPNIITGTQYFWRVLTRDALGNQSNSEIFSFEVLN